ncbi:MAG: LysR family transcriptional regulator [Candidatus Puniceispirillaceae bacterium]|jgi:DNA-binding transcriptional LysR family regulator
MQIKQRHLEVFDAIIAAGSISRAAAQLNLSQPAVSIALANFEESIGFKLFQRDRGFFAPTREALLLQDDMAQGLLALSRVSQRISEIRAGSTGSVRIATNGAMAIHFLPPLIAAYQRDHSDVNIDILVRSSRQVAEWVSSRQIDIGLIDTPVPVAGLNATLFSLECVCVMHQDDPLATKDIIHPTDLAGRSIVSITGQHMVDRQLDTSLTTAGVTVERHISSYFFAIARNIIAVGNEIAIIDPTNGKANLNDGVTWRPFAPRIDHELAIITPSDQPLGQAAGGLYDLIIQSLQKLANRPSAGYTDAK